MNKSSDYKRWLKKQSTFGRVVESICGLSLAYTRYGELRDVFLEDYSLLYNNTISPNAHIQYPDPRDTSGLSNNNVVGFKEDKYRDYDAWYDAVLMLDSRAIFNSSRNRGVSYALDSRRKKIGQYDHKTNTGWVASLKEDTQPPASLSITRASGPEIEDNFPDSIVYEIIDPSMIENVYYIIFSPQSKEMIITVVNENGEVNEVDLGVLAAKIGAEPESRENNSIIVPMDDNLEDVLMSLLGNHSAIIMKDLNSLGKKDIAWDASMLSGSDDLNFNDDSLEGVNLSGFSFDPQPLLSVGGEDSKQDEQGSDVDIDDFSSDEFPDVDSDTDIDIDTGEGPEEVDVDVGEEPEEEPEGEE